MTGGESEGPVTSRCVLVTGGSGFIGRHVVSALLDAGHGVVVADMHRSPDKRVETVVGDLRDPAVRLSAMSRGVDSVVHLAAATSVLKSVERPTEFFATNVDVSVGLSELARGHGVDTLVLASTNAVAGDVGSDTITERVVPAPLTPYGASKAAAEMLLNGYAGSFGMRAPMLRLTNVYGRGMQHKDSFVVRLMRAAASDGEVEIYGDGEQRRDLVHVSDVATAFVAALDGWPTGPVVIGGNRSYTVNEIAEAARRATGVPIRARKVPPKKGEMPAVVVDIAHARTLGFEPRVTLDQGLPGVWEDFAPVTAPR